MTPVSLTHGFTLIEVLVCILILGLSVTGLLNYLQWGQLHFRVATERWRESASLLGLQALLRKVVTQGVDPGTLPRSYYQSVLPHLKIRDMKVAETAPETFFITITFFEDRNANDVFDATEPSFQRLWCYRRRAS